MTTITDTPTRIVRYHDDSGIIEVIQFQTPDAQTQINVVRAALTPREWSEVKKVLV